MFLLQVPFFKGRLWHSSLWFLLLLGEMEQMWGPRKPTQRTHKEGGQWEDLEDRGSTSSPLNTEPLGLGCLPTTLGMRTACRQARRTGTGYFSFKTG